MGEGKYVVIVITAFVLVFGSIAVGEFFQKSRQEAQIVALIDKGVSPIEARVAIVGQR